MYIVYKITNKTNNRAYVGFTGQSLSDRICKHYTRTNRTELGEDLRSLSLDSFTIEVLSEHEDLIEAMISELQGMREYNTLAPAGYNSLYTKHSKDKIRNSQKGVAKSPEHKTAVSLGLTGLKQTPETIQKRIDHFYKPVKDQYGNVYESINAAAKAIGVSAASISHLVTGYVKAPRHGFLISYVGGK